MYFYVLTRHSSGLVHYFDFLQPLPPISFREAILLPVLQQKVNTQSTRKVLNSFYRIVFRNSQKFDRSLRGHSQTTFKAIGGGGFKKCQHQMNIYELISVCPYPGNVQMFSETTCSSQTKLIGEGLPIGEHGIGYSNLTPDSQGAWGPWGSKFKFHQIKKLR